MTLRKSRHDSRHERHHLAKVEDVRWHHKREKEQLKCIAALKVMSYSDTEREKVWIYMFFVPLILIFQPISPS